MNEDEARKILKDAQDMIKEWERNHHKSTLRRERLDRFIMTEHLIDVFENWDEFVQEHAMDPPTIYDLTIQCLKEYHESFGPIEHYVGFPNTSDFQEVLSDAIIKYDLKREIAEEAGVAVSTVERWALGRVVPHKEIFIMVYEFVKEMILEKEGPTEEKVP